MKRWIILSAMFVLSLGLVTRPLSADDAKKDGEKPEMKKDDEKPKKEPEPKLPDFSNFANAGEHAGEVIKCDENSITVRQQSRARNKTVNNDVEFKYAEGALVRKEKAPKFFNDKGLERAATSSELEKLKKPAGAPGYALERGDLKNGDLLKLVLVRPRNISAAKAKQEDLVIKYAIMVGEAAKPSAPPKK